MERSMARLRLMTSSGLRSAQCPTAREKKKTENVVELGRHLLEQLETLAQQLAVQLLGDVELGSESHDDDADRQRHDRCQRGDPEPHVFQPCGLVGHFRYQGLRDQVSAAGH
jgi:hypothetical protein